MGSNLNSLESRTDMMSLGSLSITQAVERSMAGFELDKIQRLETENASLQKQLDEWEFYHRNELMKQYMKIHNQTDEQTDELRRGMCKDRETWQEERRKLLSDIHFLEHKLTRVKNAAASHFDRHFCFKHWVSKPALLIIADKIFEIILDMTIRAHIL